MKMDQEQVQLRRFEIGQLSGEGSKYHYGDHLEKAVECYDKAYKLARDINDDETERTCAFNLGAVYIAIGNPKEGLEYLHKAIPFDDQKDEHSNGDLYFNMGLGYEKMKEFEKAVQVFREAHEKYMKFERDKIEPQIQCLEKCFQIYDKRRDHLNMAEICKMMAEVYADKDKLCQAGKLCECATQLRYAGEKKKAAEEAMHCKDMIEECETRDQSCIIAGKIWNDLGLVFTQLQDYDTATFCFEKAVEQVHSSHQSYPQLEAVVLQNLGAAYNFDGEYQRAIKYHEDAATKYASINYRNGQGQCFTNLAFALSQLGDREMKNAEIAFHHALQASLDTGDKHMEWQALEGLGAVNFNQGNIKDAVDFFIRALQCVGDNKTAGERIKNKMLLALKRNDLADALNRGQGQSHVMYTGTGRFERRVLMPTHGPAEEHNKLSTTPRSQVVESPIVAERFVPLAGERPAMAAVQDTAPPRRIIPMRKKDSIGPHHPKISHGLGSLTYDSPRFNQGRGSTKIEEVTSEDETSDSDSDSSSGSESEGEDQADQADQAKQANSQLHQVSMEKIDKIFERPKTAEVSPGDADELTRYEAHIREQEENEDNEDSEDEDSSDSSDSSSDECTSTDTESDKQEDQTDAKQSYAPPPVPTQSPPNTALVSTKHLGTYLTPNPGTVHTVADVHQQSDSSHRVARQPTQETAESPRAKSSSAEDTDSDESDDKNDEKDPYATIDTTTKLQQPVNGQDTEGPYHTLKFEREGQTGEEGESSAMKFEQLPRGEKEKIMAQYHHEHQNQDPPPVPPRSEEKSSKTCVVM